MLVTAIDRKYLPGLRALHNSIRKNSPDTPLSCLVYGDADLADEVYSLGVSVVLNPGIDAPLPVTELWPVASEAMYARLLVPKLFPNGIWIDADCIVLQPLDELSNLTFSQPVASVKTSTTTLAQQVGGLKKGGHLPALFAGLLVFNTEEWNRLQITEQCFDAMREPLDFRYAVQSVLSYVLKGSFHSLPYEWQVFANRTETTPEVVRDAKILHYVGALPWEVRMNNQEIWEGYYGENGK